MHGMTRTRHFNLHPRNNEIDAFGVSSGEQETLPGFETLDELYGHRAEGDLH